MPGEEFLQEAAVRHISGFQPEVTGGLCDGCTTAFTEDDRVQVRLWWDGSVWKTTGTYCLDHDFDLPDDATQAIVECELGAAINGEAFPLYNPEVVEVSIDDDTAADTRADGGALGTVGRRERP